MTSHLIYSDKLVEITDHDIMFRGYYFPLVSKRVHFSDIDFIIAVKPTLCTGQWRIWGGGFGWWMPPDSLRPRRDRIFVVKQKTARTRIGFTVEDADAVTAILLQKGLLKQDEKKAAALFGQPGLLFGDQTVSRSERGTGKSLFTYLIAIGVVVVLSSYVPLAVTTDRPTVSLLSILTVVGAVLPLPLIYLWLRKKANPKPIPRRPAQSPLAARRNQPAVESAKTVAVDGKWPQPGHPKPKINARAVVDQINAGMTDHQLMEKHGLSGKGLQNLFAKLMEAGLLTQSDLDRRPPPGI
jgi:hypothetical protein